MHALAEKLAGKIWGVTTHKVSLPNAQEYLNEHWRAYAAANSLFALAILWTVSILTVGAVPLLLLMLNKVMLRRSEPFVEEFSKSLSRRIDPIRQGVRRPAIGQSAPNSPEIGPAQPPAVEIESPNPEVASWPTAAATPAHAQQSAASATTNPQSIAAAIPPATIPSIPTTATTSTAQQQQPASPATPPIATSAAPSPQSTAAATPPAIISPIPTATISTTPPQQPAATPRRILYRQSDVEMFGKRCLPNDIFQELLVTYREVDSAQNKINDLESRAIGTNQSRYFDELNSTIDSIIGAILHGTYGLGRPGNRWKL
ncbi:MAG: hypothetical protein LBI39_03665, partial [Puniceicoccales bacterium]|nr:hypothetical protein [Puniceicoccales bacterium]